MIPRTSGSDQYSSITVAAFRRSVMVSNSGATLRRATPSEDIVRPASRDRISTAFRSAAQRVIETIQVSTTLAPSRSWALRTVSSTSSTARVRADIFAAALSRGRWLPSSRANTAARS